MAQTFTLSHDEVLKSPEKASRQAEAGSDPSARVLKNILDFSRNLEVRPSRLLKHVDYLKS